MSRAEIPSSLTFDDVLLIPQHSEILPSEVTLEEVEVTSPQGRYAADVDGRLRFILARGIGETFVATDVDTATVRALLSDALSMRPMP